MTGKSLGEQSDELDTYKLSASEDQFDYETESDESDWEQLKTQNTIESSLCQHEILQTEDLTSIDWLLNSKVEVSA